MLFGGRVSFFPTTVDRTAKLLFERMLEVHPQLAGYRVEYSWGGKVAMTMDRMPHIGRIGRRDVRDGLLGHRRRALDYLGTRAADWMGGGEAPALSKPDSRSCPRRTKAGRGSCRSSASSSGRGIGSRFGSARASRSPDGRRCPTRPAFGNPESVL